MDIDLLAPIVSTIAGVPCFVKGRPRSVVAGPWLEVSVTADVTRSGESASEYVTEAESEDVMGGPYLPPLVREIRRRRSEVTVRIEGSAATGPESVSRLMRTLSVSLFFASSVDAFRAIDCCPLRILAGPYPVLLRSDGRERPLIFLDIAFDAIVTVEGPAVPDIVRVVVRRKSYEP